MGRFEALLRQAAPSIRALGRSFDKFGESLEGQVGAAYTEHLNPSTRFVSAGGKSPSVATPAFVAPNASLVGDVSVGAHSAVWYGASLRAEGGASISIGQHATVGDRVAISGAKPTTIGDRASVGAGALLEGATLSAESAVGAGATLSAGASVQKHAMVGAGAVVSAGTVVKTGQLWAGAPAAFVRELAPAEIDSLKLGAVDALALSAAHAEEAAKSHEELEAAAEARKELAERDPDHQYHPNPNLAPERRGLIYNAGSDQA